MSTPSDAVPGLEAGSHGIASAPPSQTRPFYWSVRRELWENRSIFIAPLIVALVVVLGAWLSTIGLPHRRRATLLLDPGHQRAAVEAPYDAAAGMLLVTAFIVGIFYCVDALHGERRDRSILFWKSLPVSDLTTVLSKASVPLVILPLLTLVIVTAAQLMILLQSTAVLLMNGATAAMLAPQLKYTLHPVGLIYAVIIIALWHAPIYAWFLLVSAWARRAAFLWAVLPFFAAAIFERLAFHTAYIGLFLRARLIGWFIRGFVPMVHGSMPADPMKAITPLRFLSSPGLWIGLAFAAAFVAATVRVRRYRAPL